MYQRQIEVTNHFIDCVFCWAEIWKLRETNQTRHTMARDKRWHRTIHSL